MTASRSGRQPSGGTTARTHGKEALIPPHGGLKPDRHAFEIRMPAVDDDIALHTRDDGRDDQDCASVLHIPLASEATGRFSVWPESVRDDIGGCDLVAGSPEYGDLDEMLVRRQGSVPVSQLFQHGRRVALGSIDHLDPRFMPPAGDALGALRASHRKTVPLNRRSDTPASLRARFAVSSKSRAGLGPMNEVQDRFRTRRAGPCHVERRLPFQQRMGPVQERVDGIPVPVVGAADRINDTPHFIEPFAKESLKNPCRDSGIYGNPLISRSSKRFK